MHLAGLQPAEGVLGAETERVAGAGHPDAQQLGQPLRDRPQARGLDDLAVGPAQVAHEDDDGATLGR